ncbi:hypothetical protein GCM10023192_28660 [Amycolatopsis samaneae]
MRREETLSRLRETVARWYADQVSAGDIVFAACDLLVAGIDGPAVVAVAAVDVSAADEKVPELVEELLRETGFAVPGRGSDTADEHALRVLAALTAAGALEPRRFLFWAAARCAQDGMVLADRLSSLEGSYEAMRFLGGDPERLDEQVLDEAHRLAGR